MRVDKVNPDMPELKTRSQNESRWARWRDWIRALMPAPVTVNAQERWRATCGAMVGLLCTAVMCRLVTGAGPDTGAPASTLLPMALVAPLGASAVLVFALPSSPMAQPWAVVTGHFVSALVGVTCARLIDNPLIAAPVAGGLAIAAMFALRCLHPPGGPWP